MATSVKMPFSFFKTIFVFLAITSFLGAFAEVLEPEPRVITTVVTPENTTIETESTKQQSVDNTTTPSIANATQDTAEETTASPSTVAVEVEMITSRAYTTGEREELTTAKATETREELSTSSTVNSMEAEVVPTKDLTTTTTKVIETATTQTSSSIPVTPKGLTEFTTTTMSAESTEKTIKEKTNPPASDSDALCHPTPWIFLLTLCMSYIGCTL